MNETAALYAGSLYTLACEEGLEAGIGEELRDIAEIMTAEPDYRTLLQEPSIRAEERKRLMDEAFGPHIHEYTLNFLKLLCDRNLLGSLGEISREYSGRYDRDHGIMEAVVTSAVALTEEQMAALGKKLAEISGKTVRLSQKTDSSVIAGLRVDMDGYRYDGTASGRLAALRKAVKG